MEISISQDENTMAVATNKGFIYLIDGFVNDTVDQDQVYSHHEGNIITALRWSLNDLYCGDQTGHISVISRTNKLVRKKIL